MRDQELCRFCSTNIEELVSVVPFNETDLKTLIDATETLGRKLGCAKDRMVCEPLKLLQYRVDRLKLGLK
jgi:hypothetical protein